MARMVATKAALSIRVDALSDADSKSSVDAASIGIENRAKLESRLRALEYRSDLTTTTPFRGEKKKEQPRFEMKTEVKQYNTAADAVGFLPTQRQGAEALAINAVLDVKEEKRREKEDKRRAKEEKRKRKADAAVAAAIEESPKSEPKDGMSSVCEPLMHLTYLSAAIPVPMETDEERKERKRLKKEKKRAEAAAATDAAIAAAIAPTSNVHAGGSEKKKSKKRKHDEDDMEIDSEKKKKKRRKE